MFPFLIFQAVHVIWRGFFLQCTHANSFYLSLYLRVAWLLFTHFFLAYCCFDIYLKSSIITRFFERIYLPQSIWNYPWLRPDWHIWNWWNQSPCWILRKHISRSWQNISQICSCRGHEKLIWNLKEFVFLKWVEYEAEAAADLLIAEANLSRVEPLLIWEIWFPNRQP